MLIKCCAKCAKNLTPFSCTPDHIFLTCMLQGLITMTCMCVMKSQIAENSPDFPQRVHLIKLKHQFRIIDPMWGETPSCQTEIVRNMEVLCESSQWKWRYIFTIGWTCSTNIRQQLKNIFLCAVDKLNMSSTNNLCVILSHGLPTNFRNAQDFEH